MIGEMILINEINSSVARKSLKFTVAADCSSRFSKLYPIQGRITKKIVLQVLRISDEFLFYKKSINDPSWQIRCDHSPAYVAAV